MLVDIISSMELSQSQLEDATDKDLNFVECPVCGYDDAESSRGVKMHYSYADDETHPDKITGAIRCNECDKIKLGGSKDQKYCSGECRTLAEVGTLKHQDEDFLRKRIEKEGVRAVEIAEEIGVDAELVHKWVRKYDIGKEHECPHDDCNRSFGTSQGVSKHHKEVHGESIRGNYYECKRCGDVHWTPRSENDKRFPKFCPLDVKNCRSESMRGENNPNKNPERQEKISRGMIKAYAEGRKKVRGREPIYNPLTGNKLDSGWEKKVDTILYKSDYDYKYNGSGGFKRYKINNFTHAPDFIIDDVVDEDIIIEVKGRQTVFYQEGKMNEIADNLTERPDVIYVMIGDSNGLSSDYFIEYKNRDRLVDIIDKISGKQKNSLFGY